MPSGVQTTHRRIASQISGHKYGANFQRSCHRTHSLRERRRWRTSSRWRCRASVQENNKEDLLDDLSEEEFAFKRPKFQAFVGQSERGEQLRSFRHKAKVKGGHLMIQPLGKEHLSAATELLTVTFADSIGYMPMYRGFLKKQVKEYLHSHTNIAPKAVILEAVLLEAGSESEEELPEPDESVDTILSKTEDSVSWLDTSPAFSSFPDNISQDNAEPAGSPFQANPLAVLGETLMGSVDNLLDTGSDSQDSNGTAFEGPEPPQGSGGDSEGTPAPSPSYTEENAVESSMDNTGVDTELHSNGTAGREWRGAAEGEEQSVGEDQQNAEREQSAAEAKQPAGQLIGTVELSFTASTRTKSLTLNPPEDGVYLCNMAVDENHKRKGYGMQMLAAAEALLEVAGARRVWLHVRLKDEPALGLYSKAGYAVEKEDCVLVGLWDDRRQLLSKFIPRRKPISNETPDEKVEPVERPVAEYWQ